MRITRLWLLSFLALGLLSAGIILNSQSPTATAADQTAADQMAVTTAGDAPGEAAADALYLPFVLIPYTNFLPLVSSAQPIDAPYPANNSTRQSRNAYLAWEVRDRGLEGATFTVYLDADNTEPDTWLATVNGVILPDLPTFAEDTQYYWKVVATKPDGTNVESPVWTFRTDYFPDPPEIGTMVRVPAGEFQMGCDPDNSGYLCFSNQVPKHAVYLDEFEIDKFEVTNKEYRACVDAGECQLPRKLTSNVEEPYFNDAEFDYYPVMFVSHWDAEDYCSWAGKRLPTEAEWEKAARGTLDSRPWPWGSEPWDCEHMNRCGYGDTWHTAPVGEFSANQSIYGAVNMSGNLFEWVQDQYYDYYYSMSPYENPVNTEQLQDQNIPFFSIRGGSYHDNWWYARANHRSGGHWGDEAMGDSPLFRSFRVGFRCAQSVTD